MKHVTCGALAITAIFCVTPVLAFAQDAGGEAADTTATSATADYSSTFAFQRQGVFGCSINGSYSMSVGALSAVGGTYVPVNDAAVTLNTGYLVYKECVLRGIVNRMREDASSAIQKQILVAYNRGRNGLPLYSQSLQRESVSVYTDSIARDLTGTVLDVLPPSFQAPVKKAIVQGYMQAINAPNRSLACSYAGDLETLQQRPTQFKGNIWEGLFSLRSTNCIPFYAAENARNLVLGNAASRWDDQFTQLQWGRGTYPIQTTDENGDLITVTPGSLVAANAQQALQTGFTQLQNANDIDQMVGALFAGITSQVVSDNRGLAGITQKTGSQASYLDQVAKESAAGLRNSALNAAIQILAAAKQVEVAYLAAMNAIGTALLDTMNQLRSKENACWNLVISSVCADSLKADNTCSQKMPSCTPTATTTCPTIKLKIATSTQYSQGVINARITPLASSTAVNIQASENSNKLIDDLLAGVANTTSLNAQRVALQQLDGLVSQRKLHTQYDAQNAQQTKTDVVASMTTLLQDTIVAWGDSTDPNVGWCNVNNPTVVQMWMNNWKQ
jgi:hypothetical protein